MVGQLTKEGIIIYGRILFVYDLIKLNQTSVKVDST